MKLFVDSASLENEFDRLINQYDKLYWNVAWAGIDSNGFDRICANEHKIEKVVIGLHFYQTHPTFISRFLSNKKVRYIKQPAGTYHPKLYLFFTSETKWEAIVGSSNFTKSGFSINTEANILITSQDNDSQAFLRQAFLLINECWSQSAVFSSEELSHYTMAWKNFRPKLKSLSGIYGGNQAAKVAAYQVPAVSMTWKEFIKNINNHVTHNLNDRLAVLDMAQSLFSSVIHFHELDEQQRRFIGGVYSDVSPNWGYFGSMIGRGNYVHEIIHNNLSISKALDEIPLKGQITQTHYLNFVKIFAPIFSGNYVGVASRLLSMKRPDVFYCFTSKNQSGFCRDFSISKKEINYEGYWQHAIERIYDSEWWLNPAPSNAQEKRISEYRAAFLDAIYYEEGTWSAPKKHQTKLKPQLI